MGRGGGVGVGGVGCVGDAWDTDIGGCQCWNGGPGSDVADRGGGGGWC